MGGTTSAGGSALGGTTSTGGRASGGATSSGGSGGLGGTTVGTGGTTPTGGTGGTGGVVGSGGSGALGGTGGPDGSVDCGNLTAPMLPATAAGFSINKVLFNGHGNVVQVSPGAQLLISLDYVASDPVCPLCWEQLEIGLSPGNNVLFCAFNAKIGEPKTGNGVFATTAPSQPGLYTVRFGIGLNYSCTSVADDCGNGVAPPCGSFSNAPNGNADIGLVCVK